MVAINALSLLAVLPALAMAAAVPGGSSHHVARNGAHARHHGIAARAVGSGAQHRPRRRGEQQCRPRPAPAATQAVEPAAADAIPTDSGSDAAPEQDSEEAAPPPQDEGAAAPQETQGSVPHSNLAAAPQDENASAPKEEESAPPSESPASAPEEPAPEEKPAPGEPAPAPVESAPPAPQPTEEYKAPESSNSGGGGNPGLLYASGPCGDNQPDAQNPNGQQWWFNCGINEGGWNPPFLTMDQVKYVDFETNEFFAPCQPYKEIMKAAAAKYNIPPTFIAAIAMQESTCNPSLTGGAGEQGMMQLVGVNCDGAPNGDCKDVWFNIHSGARYLREMTDNNGGSLLLGLGAYNGWHPGMTRHDVQVKADSWGCFAQQNLDYMQEFLNGWLQGKEGWKLATIKNRENC